MSSGMPSATSTSTGNPSSCWWGCITVPPPLRRTQAAQLTVPFPCTPHAQANKQDKAATVASGEVNNALSLTQLGKQWAVCLPNRAQPRVG